MHVSIIILIVYIYFSDEYYEYLCKKADWFQSQEDIKADLTKLPTDYDSHISDLPTEAVEGSFRELILD